MVRCYCSKLYEGSSRTSSCFKKMNNLMQGIRTAFMIVLFYTVQSIVFVSDAVGQFFLLEANTGTDVSFVVPCGIDSIAVQAWGGGGGGGGGTGRGGGGGGAAFAFRRFAVTPGQIFTYTIGSGGIIAANGNGGNGGNTSFRLSGTNIVVAEGGRGGNSGGSGAGGAGGTFAGSVGATIYIGGNGASGTATVSGGGGGSANNLGPGHNGSGATGGNGGNDNFNPPTSGKGGNGHSTGTNHGLNANFYGGGGGGGRGSGTYGGYGTGGRIVIHGYSSVEYIMPSLLCVGSSITLTPTMSPGTVSNITVSPALPAGLSLNSTTGVISGTPTSTSTTSHTVTVTYTCGTVTSTVINLTISGPSTAGLSIGDWVFTGVVSTTYEHGPNWVIWNGSTFSIPSTVPQITDNVRIKPISQCVTRQPTVTNLSDFGFTPPISVSANCRNIVIESGATLTMASSTPNPHFHVAENLTDNGTIVPGTGRLKCIGTGNQSINSVHATENFYEFNVGANSITTINCNVSVTNLINLNGVVVTGSRIFHLLNSNSAASLPSHSGHVYGTFRRAIASNTDTYVFPVGVGTTLVTHKRLLEYLNNNITGVSYLDCSVSNTFKGGGQNTDPNLDPVKARHFSELFTYVHPEAEWSLIPNVVPSGGNYGLRLYVMNFSGLIDNTFGILKRPDASTTFFDYNSFYLTTQIPSDNLPGRIFDGGNGYAQKLNFTAFSKFAIASSPVPLSVTLFNFSLVCNDENSVVLQWSTASEQNSNKFIVQRSRDADTWVTLGSVPSAGNSNQLLHYSFEDISPFSGTSYYRLIHTDYDGIEKKYGPIVSSCNSIENGISVFPNPSKGSFTVEISSVEIQRNVHLQLIDLSGKVVFTRIIDLYKGSNQFPFELELSKGMYMLQVGSEKFDYGSFKLISE